MLTIIVQTIASIVLVASVTFCGCIALVVLSNQLQAIMTTWRGIRYAEEQMRDEDEEARHSACAERFEVVRK